MHLTFKLLLLLLSVNMCAPVCAMEGRRRGTLTSHRGARSKQQSRKKRRDCSRASCLRTAFCIPGPRQIAQTAGRWTLKAWLYSALCMQAFAQPVSAETPAPSPNQSDGEGVTVCFMCAMGICLYASSECCPENR